MHIAGGAENSFDGRGPNPSVKGTSKSGLRPLAADPYVES